MSPEEREAEKNIEGAVYVAKIVLVVFLSLVAVGLLGYLICWISPKLCRARPTTYRADFQQAMQKRGQRTREPVKAPV